MSRSAIIDIGSNAIRASVYDSRTLGAKEVYNDKFRSDVRDFLKEDDIAHIKHPLFLIFEHFIHIFNNLNVKKVTCIATEVLREHPKAAEFQKLIKQKFKIDVEILSGTNESKYGAMGVMHGIEGAAGIVADLGGGSLEISEVNSNEIKDCVSLKLGGQVLQGIENLDEEYIIHRVEKVFTQRHIQNLYFIGGSLRLLGRIYMEYTRYPLQNLHNLVMPQDELLICLDRIEGNIKSGRPISKFSKLRNVEFFHSSIILARALISFFNPDNIIISNYGLKEGVHFCSLSEDERAKDVLWEKASYLSGLKISDIEFNKYSDILEPLLVKQDPEILRMLSYAIILSELVCNIDKQFRALLFADFILALDIPFNHKQRTMLAIIVSYINSSKVPYNLEKMGKSLLSRDEYRNTKIAGNLLKITYDVDGIGFKQPTFFISSSDYGRLSFESERMVTSPVFRRIKDSLKNIALIRKFANS